MRSTSVIALGTVTDSFANKTVTDVTAAGGTPQVGAEIDLSLYDHFTAQLIVSAAAGAGGAMQMQESTDLVNWANIGTASAALAAAGSTIIHGTNFGQWVRVVMSDGGAGPDSITGHVRIYAKTVS